MAPDETNILPPLLAAVAAADARLGLVIGAGCSLETPTRIPLAGDLAEEVHTQLVADGVLVEGECVDPRDLPVLVELVAAKAGGSQAGFVSAMRPNRFRN